MKKILYRPQFLLLRRPVEVQLRFSSAPFTSDGDMRIRRRINSVHSSVPLQFNAIWKNLSEDVPARIIKIPTSATDMCSAFNHQKIHPRSVLFP